MGIITRVSDTEIDWTFVQPSEPPAGRYTWRGRNSSGSDVFQCNADPTIVCIRISNALVAVDVAELQNVGRAPTGGGANYGLTQTPDTVYSYNVASQTASAVRENGRNISATSPSASSTAPQASVAQTLGLPSFITGSDGRNYYPREYWYQTGNVHYYSPTPPARIIDEFLASSRSSYYKIQDTRLTLQNVRAYSQQARTPDQSAVMGTAVNGQGSLSAREHLTAIFGIVQEPRSWHWCHLVAHSMRPNANGQVADNLVAGTAGLNGAMLALENAVKAVLDRSGAPAFLDYEASADVFTGTHIAKFVRVIVGQSEWSSTFYFEATIAERDLTAQTREFTQRIVDAYQESQTPASSSSSSPASNSNSNSNSKPGGGGSQGFGSVPMSF